MEIIILALLLITVAEVTYLVAVNTKKISYKDKTRPIFVDTSVLIDGRIITVAKSGFVIGKLSIPRSVIGELQFLADNADPEKRSRARHGLDIVTELQAMPGVEVEIFQDDNRAKEGVDDRLLKLAKQYNGVICTIDYNLNKVAQVENITVLNVNDLAMGLRMSYLPGEKILLELTQKGQDGHQAVGHLKDGTMVVVEHASGQIGQTIEVEFIRSLQTAAGKMMFAKVVERGLSNNLNNKPVGKKRLQPVKKEIQKPVLNVAKSPEKSTNSGSRQSFNKPKTDEPKRNDNRSLNSNQSKPNTNKSRSKNSQKRGSNKLNQIEQSIIDLSNNQ